MSANPSPNTPTPQAQRPLSPPPAPRGIRVEQSAFAGPLPPPEVLANYNQILPGLAERIVTMAETQSRHRQHIEEIAIASKIQNERHGQYLAFILAAIALVGSFWVIALGKSPAGITGIIGTLATLAAVFVYGRRSQQKELLAKRRDIESRVDSQGER